MKDLATRLLFFSSILVLLAGCKNTSKPLRPGMAFIEGGIIEINGQQLQVPGFFMDSTEVTNRQFKDFVEATGYKTEAELPFSSIDTTIGDSMLPPNSLVFFATEGPVDLQIFSQW